MEGKSESESKRFYHPTIQKGQLLISVQPPSIYQGFDIYILM
jgi:hypothetical protein